MAMVTYLSENIFKKTALEMAEEKDAEFTSSHKHIIITTIYRPIID